MNRRMLSQIAVAPLFTGLLFAAERSVGAPRSAPAKQKDETQEVWIHHGNCGAFVAEGAQWDFVKKRVDGFGFFIHSLTKTDMETLKALANVLRENRIQVSVECGGVLTLKPLDETLGERTAALEEPAFRRFEEAGGKIDFLNLDGPIRRQMADPLDLNMEPMASLDMAVGNLIDSLKRKREKFPEMQFFLLTNFPNWGYKGGPAYYPLHGKRQGWGDYFPTVEAAIRKTREAGVPLRAITVDTPYDYAMGERPGTPPAHPDPKSIDWIARLRDLEDYVEGEGLEFNLIVNSERGGNPPGLKHADLESASAEVFCKDVLSYIDAYRAAGGSPKRWIVESWYKLPRKVTPETEPYTMTHIVKEVIKRVKGISEGEERDSARK